jgi:hypothetical protein
MYDTLENEIKSYSQDLLAELLFSQHMNEKYINDKCMNCRNHECIVVTNRDIHICDDNWSGLNVGKHVFYSETKDICREMKGFKHV